MNKSATARIPSTHLKSKLVSPTIRSPRNFSHFASKVAQWCGKPWAFGMAFTLVLLWAITGPYFHYSESWQIIINTGTTIVTFLMVFVIQSSQNRDGLALHLKLDELIKAVEGARNNLVAAEEMDEAKLQELQDSFRDVAREAQEIQDAAKDTVRSKVKNTAVAKRKVSRK